LSQSEPKRAVSPGRALGVAAAGMALVAVAMRIHNAIAYPQRWGYDGLFNERYVARLLESWTLPAPDTDWSTAHPPLFYYLSAGLGRLLGLSDSIDVVIPARIGTGLIGLTMAGLAFVLVRRASPDDPRRAVLAAGLVLFLPVQIYMSAMLNEEILAATFTSLALFGVCGEVSRRDPGERAWLRDALIGLAAGLALLTKLTGILVLGAALGAYLWVGIREGRLGTAIRRGTVVAVVALLVGGWFYGRNLAVYGYLYPQDLSTHELMFSMPPGERHLGDYLRVPLATFTDPQVLNPDLLRSVWGSTYVTLWFEGHGHFLPKDEPAVARLGTALLVLALLPTAAFGLGFLRAARRGLRNPRSPEAPMAMLVALTLAGYAVFTWGNPWFATVKASYLLGISIPFAYFASDVLSGWMRNPDRALAIWIVLGALVVGICAAFTTDIGLWNLTPDGALPGLQWDGAPTSAPGGLPGGLEG
jgi:4-amino-4-deoxy-L-arabinose transferase-like glycosyltransferase